MKTTNKNTTATSNQVTKFYPKWTKADTRAAADKMDDAQYALCQARDAWVAAGKPATTEHTQNSERLQKDLEAAMSAFKKLSNRDMAEFFASK